LVVSVEKKENFWLLGKKAGLAPLVENRKAKKKPPGGAQRAPPQEEGVLPRSAPRKKKKPLAGRKKATLRGGQGGPKCFKEGGRLSPIPPQRTEAKRGATIPVGPEKRGKKPTSAPLSKK